MSRTVTLALLLVSVVLVVFPLTAPVPGLPATLKADEPGYLLAALSLVHDRDMRCDTGDLERLFRYYPYLTTRNLILATDDGWNTLSFGKPYLYSLLAAPLVAVFGPSGMVAFNMALLVAMIWMGADYLRRHNGDGLAALFAVGFFLFSTSFSYVFWMHPEVLNMASGMGCLYFGLHVARCPPAVRRGLGRLLDPRLAPILSGACLAFGVYNKPMLAALGLPVLARLALDRRLKPIVAWGAGATVAIGLFAAGSWLLTGHPTAYLGVDRAGFHVETPYEPPVVPSELDPEEEEWLAERSAGWWWIFRIPDDVSPPELREDAVYFLFGRHTGLFLYQPWSLLALALFLAHGRRSPVRWVLFLALVLVATFILVWISFNWHGGGGFVGNRYFVIVYPGFLFLVTRIRPDWTPVVGYGLGALLLGPMLLTPFGAVVPQATLQSHARGLPFQYFPYELSLREVPGHHGVVFHQVWFRARKDQMRPIDQAMWLQGNDRIEIWAQSEQALDSLVFDVSSLAPENRVTLAVGDARVTLAAGRAPQRVVLRPTGPSKVRIDDIIAGPGIRTVFYTYRLVVTTETGELPRWRGERPHTFYLGAAITYRGTEAQAAADAAR